MTVPVYTSLLGFSFPINEKCWYNVLTRFVFPSRAYRKECFDQVSIYLALIKFDRFYTHGNLSKSLKSFPTTKEREKRVFLNRLDLLSLGKRVITYVITRLLACDPTLPFLLAFSVFDTYLSFLWRYSAAAYLLLDFREGGGTGLLPDRKPQGSRERQERGSKPDRV